MESALETAEHLCSGRGVNLTKVRRRVLELIWRSHEPVGAYALLDILKDEGFNSAPPTVYRALDFLLEQGFIHRLESRNAFIGCPDPAHPHEGRYLICDQCGTVQEVDDEAFADALAEMATRHGFRVRRATVEISGLCGTCLTSA
jgi:Fur family zinc uptake transcriptional regulator